MGDKSWQSSPLIVSVLAAGFFLAACITTWQIAAYGPWWVMVFLFISAFLIGFYGYHTTRLFDLQKNNKRFS